MLSIIIPSRNEVYLKKTIDSVLAAATGEIEVLAICDGYWPDPPIDDDPRVRILHNSKPLGQRQGINDAVGASRGEFILKLDAHCLPDEGFDVKLAADYQDDWTVIPRMYNLQVFDWKCKNCGWQKHAHNVPPKCSKCEGYDFEKVMVWKPKLHKLTDYMYISSPNADKPFRAQYYNRRQPKKKELIDDVMLGMGPFFFMSKKRFWDLGGMDERHGSWGQMGIEVGLKAWTSGGSHKVNKKTWIAHWFRGGGGPGAPYSMSGTAQDRARTYSQDLWLNNKWEGQVKSLQWVIEKFNPPGWEEWTKANPFKGFNR